MTLKKCPRCGCAAEIRAEATAGRLYSIRAICTGCGKRGKQTLNVNKPAEGAASVYWAGMNWNIGLYEQEADT